ncbi:ferric-chelate reductase 1 [Lingula anatina]|uniref:Ferric-chelate reductase 1 n=1 Tax=Lingula anatina TaxID=7574 RepID=A0A1S3KC61_LINAN|nr:ferric-chelate reductase 1 [Lingula anatina]XP_013420217.1 ferric-chelate reductase 1 [Lingula anatina]XP_013420218.1 ferric-chelate reductase 1 [Lingula anatina]XP_013420219.1 ferric-chelate reductase 1 [Lingula anatina]XP_013420220.1 ferric-chelate reductase 1 [Lingula anatina]XP_013420221.1 ferric-chelate reductase 1 [Lingula anatina]|eukprot:XP_013420216.1 ferric-chelate reductase 1 [Lingula anatina]
MKTGRCAGRILTIFFGLFLQGFSYPNGGILKTCVNLLPKHHGTNQQTGKAPYTLSVAKDTYKPGEDIAIELKSQKIPFRGFQIMVHRREGDTEELIGNFTEFSTDSKPFKWYSENINCLTHSDNEDKTKVQFKWKAPGVSEGDLIVRAAFVKDFEHFWANETHVLRAEVPVVVNETFPWRVSMDFKPMRVREECGVTKGCVKWPRLCQGEDCDVLVMYKTEGDHIDFEMFGKAEAYLSLAFSDDKKMGKDETITCMYKESVIQIQHGYNPMYFNERIRNTVLSNVEMMRDGERMYCRFRRPLSFTPDLWLSLANKYPPTPIKAITFDLSKPWILFLGWGHLYTGTDVVGHHKELPLITSSPVDFQSTAVHYGQTLSVEVQAHGTLMTVAWVALAGFAMVVARHYRNAFGNNCCGIKLWFQIHRLIMILVAGCTAAGIVLIFVYVGDWREVATLHAGFGLAVMGIVLLQMIMAFCRPDPDASRRRVFNWAHRIFGKLSHVVAVVALFLGVNLSLLPEKFRFNQTVVLGVWVITQILWEVILEIMKCRREASDKREITISMDPIGNGDHTKSSLDSVENPRKKQGSAILACALALYGITLLVFVAAILALIYMF